MATKTAKATKRIISVKLRREQDDCPDLSYLGEYGNSASDTSIDRQERGDAGRNEYRYFTPAMTADETGNPESPEQDYQRCEAYDRGVWWMIGIWAEATVCLTGNVTQRIRSGGLWGIESDSGKDYLQSVADEELTTLKNELLALGFTARQIKSAFDNAERDD